MGSSTSVAFPVDGLFSRRVSEIFCRFLLVVLASEGCNGTDCKNNTIMLSIVKTILVRLSLVQVTPHSRIVL